MPVGETRQSDHINFVHWSMVKLTAWRDGNRWKIKNGDQMVSSDTIEYETWDGTDWYAAWEGDNFRHTPSNHAPSHTSRTLNYLGHVQSPQAEKWQCVWDPKLKLFTHTRFA